MLQFLMDYLNPMRLTWCFQAHNMGHILCFIKQRFTGYLAPLNIYRSQLDFLSKIKKSEVLGRCVKFVHIPQKLCNGPDLYVGTAREKREEFQLCFYWSENSMGL